MDRWFAGSMDRWFDGSLDRWSHRSLVRWIDVSLYFWRLVETLTWRQFESAGLNSSRRISRCFAPFFRILSISRRESVCDHLVYIYICLVLLLIVESSLCLPWGKFNWFFLYIWIYILHRHSSDWGFSTLAEVSKRAEQGFIPQTKNTQLNKILKKMWSEDYLTLCYRFFLFELPYRFIFGFWT